MLLLGIRHLCINLFLNKFDLICSYLPNNSQNFLFTYGFLSFQCYISSYSFFFCLLFIIFIVSFGRMGVNV